MSPREKKLLIFFGTAGFIVLNFIGFNFYNKYRLSVENDRAAAKLALETAEMFRNSSAEMADQFEWLEKYEPEPAAPQDVQTTLQQLAESAASATGLTLKGQKFLPTDTSGTYYHRAKVQLQVSGTEKSLYDWLDRLNDPNSFRSATYIRLSPNSTDDTKIDCVATIEQWFIPAET